MIYDDFDIDDEKNSAREVSLASTKLVVGQNVSILAERLMLNQRVGRQKDEICCVENMIDVLSRYLNVLKNDDHLTEEVLKKELADLYDSCELLTPEDLAKQLQEIRKQGGVQVNVETDDGMD